MFQKIKNSYVGRLLDFCLRKIKTFWRWYKGLYKGSKWYKKTLVAIVSAIVAFFVYLGMVDINFLWLFGKSPGFSQIKKPTTSEASEIYSADGVMIGKYFSEKYSEEKYYNAEKKCSLNALVNGDGIFLGYDTALKPGEDGKHR